MYFVGAYIDSIPGPDLDFHTAKQHAGPAVKYKNAMVVGVVFEGGPATRLYPEIPDDELLCAVGFADQYFAVSALVV